MTLVKSDVPKLLTAGLKTNFFHTFGTTPTTYEKIATVIPSTQDTEQYAWLGALPGVREFLDERQQQDFAPYEYAIKNKTWESTVAIDRAALEDDRYGQIAMRVREMAQSARQHIDILTYGLLSGGVHGQVLRRAAVLRAAFSGTDPEQCRGSTPVRLQLAGRDHDNGAVCG